MKKLISLCLICLLALGCASALAEGETAATVSAQGTASVTLIPDIASFTIGVSTQDALVTTAQTANAQAMQGVIDKLRELGVAEEDIRTDNYSVNPLYDYQNGKFGDQQLLKGYEISNTVSVTVRQLDQVSTLLDAAVAAGANQTYGLSFDSTQSVAAYDQALQSATQDALRKARLIAQANGSDVGAVLSLTELASAYTPYANARTIAYDSAATPIASGSLTVTATVQAVVELK